MMKHHFLPMPGKPQFLLLLSFIREHRQGAVGRSAVSPAQGTGLTPHLPGSLRALPAPCPGRDARAYLANI